MYRKRDSHITTAPEEERKDSDASQKRAHASVVVVRENKTVWVVVLRLCHIYLFILKKDSILLNPKPSYQTRPQICTLFTLSTLLARAHTTHA